MERVARLKLILWMFVGLAAAVATARFLFGLGATTHLSDGTPWGLWVGFDVMGGVALAAGGFVVTATVYIFKLEKYHSIVRPAVLTAFLGYVAVVVGLLFDLGLPWHIWHMMIYWNPHSPLFEVGWCVMLYLTVLTMEFFPVAAEDFSALARVRRFLIKFRIPLVILGIALSTLHQSSLGSLFLIMPYRLFPLWYSPILPVLFFVSAVGLGLMMVILESHFTAFLYRRKPETHLMYPLGVAARWVLILYLALRFGDMAVRGELHGLLGGQWQVKLFWFEIALMLVIPLILLFTPQFREKTNWQWATAAIATSGIVLNRIDVGGLADLSRGNTLYLPEWTEIVVSLGIVAAATLVFLVMIEHFKVWEQRPADREADPRKLPEFNKVGLTWLGTPVIAGRVKYSLAFVVAAGAGFLFLGNPRAASQGVEPTPVHRARGDVMYLKTGLATYQNRPGPQEDGGEGILYLDADLTGYGVKFYHQREVDRNGGEKSCVLCHHMNMPRDKDSGCYECHRDMYLPTDSFRHDWHASPSGANLACVECHARGYARTSAHVKPCVDCHKHLVPAGATIKIKTYTAPSYVDAMHQLCIGCHAKVALKENKPEVARCVECHKGKLNYAGAQNLLYRRRALTGRLVVLPPATPAKANEAK
ncbi:MAG TPA: Ni/Fe-hydrogenase cytochrome b subunit [Terriglobia bacterium]|nr:Ni/Fe-hydrogenase cytochrome b subunit [Terriglobia bacterium]